MYVKTHEIVHYHICSIHIVCLLYFNKADFYNPLNTDVRGGKGWGKNTVVPVKNKLNQFLKK